MVALFSYNFLNESCVLCKKMNKVFVFHAILANCDGCFMKKNRLYERLDSSYRAYLSFLLIISRQHI